LENVADVGPEKMKIYNKVTLFLYSLIICPEIKIRIIIAYAC
jgi:hypothetical protein